MIERLLILFNERVDRLQRSGLSTRMKKRNYVLSCEDRPSGDWIWWDGVSEDAVDAFVLNVRLLVQDTDGFSIRCLAEDVYVRETIPVDLKDRFLAARRKWREYIERNSLIKHPNREGNFTNQELFEVLMYGGMAHANPDKVEMFMTLTKRGVFSAFVAAEFLTALRILLEAVVDIRSVNDDLLRRLSANNSSNPTGFSAGATKPVGQAGR